MKDRSTRTRLSAGQTFDCGDVGQPHESLDLNEQAAWIDLVHASPLVLERFDHFWLELASRVLADHRQGKRNRTLLNQCLRGVRLKIGPEPKPAELLNAWKPQRATMN